MKTGRSSLFILLIFSCLTALSQTGDSLWFNSFTHRINLSLIADSRINNLALLNDERQVMVFRNNRSIPTYGMQFSYKWINFLFSTSIPELGYTNPQVNGRSTDFSLALGITRNEFWGRVFWEKTQGYYLSNPEAFDPDYFRMNSFLPFYPNLQSEALYGIFNVALNRGRYSHRAFLWQSEKQVKSAGTPVLGMTVGYQRYSSTDGLIPPQVSVRDSSFYDITQVRYWQAGFTFGYTYAWVFHENWTLGAMINPGINVLWSEFSSTSEDLPNLARLGLQVEARAQLGWDNDRWFSSISASNLSFSTFLSDGTPVARLTTYFKLNLGYRIPLKPIPFLKPFGLSN